MVKPIGERPGSGGDGFRGARFGGFEIVEQLGSGGMGEVYVAQQFSPAREVALKLLSPSVASNPTALDRFLREARLMASLDHPNIVPVISSGVADGRPWIAMRLVRGRSLEEVLRERVTLGVEEALAVTLRMARALAVAHAAGVVHRDLKPGNILVEGEARDITGAEIYLADFGLASLGDGTTLTFSGEILGTPAYMSPEQARGERVDTRSDLYSLGATLYAMLAGRPPFDAASYLRVLRQIGTRDPAPLRRRNGRVDRDAALICDKAMRHDARERYETAEDLAGDIERRLGRMPIRARPASVRYRASLWVRRNPRVVVASTLVIVLALAGFVLERAWRRDGTLDRVRELLANGSATDAAELVRETPTVVPFAPWPDKRRLRLEVECARATGELARSVDAAAALPEGSRGAALRSLGQFMDDQLDSARHLAELEDWGGGLKISLEVLEGLERLVAVGSPRNLLDGLRADVVEVVTMSLLESGSTTEAIAFWEAPRTRKPNEVDEIRSALHEAWRDTGARRDGSTAGRAPFWELLSPAVDALPPRNRLELLGPTSLNRGLARTRARTLMKFARASAALAFDDRSVSVAGTERRERDAGAETKRIEALRIFHLIDAYRHVLGGAPAALELAEEIASWIDVLERVRPAVLPVRTLAPLDSAGDIDGDGDPELIFALDDRVEFHSWTAAGLVRNSLLDSAWSAAAPGEVEAIEVLDVFGGGARELVVSAGFPGRAGFWLRVWSWNPRTSSFVPVSALHGPCPVRIMDAPNAIAAGDIDGDDEPELIASIRGVQDTERKVWIVEDLAVPAPGMRYLPNTDLEAGDVGSVLIGDFDGHGTVAAAVTGNWKGYDIRFWRFDPEGQEYVGPFRLGPFGAFRSGVALELDGGDPSEILAVRHPFSPSEENTTLGDGMFVLRLPRVALDRGVEVLRPNDFEPDWLWKDLPPLPIDHPGESLGCRTLFATRLNNRALVASSWSSQTPTATYAYIDLLRGGDRKALHRHRIFWREHDGVRCALVEREGRTGLAVWIQDPTDATAGGRARIWELDGPLDEVDPFPSALIDGYFRLGRFETAAEFARKREEAAARRNERARLQLAEVALKARSQNWSDALTALESASDADSGALADWRRVIDPMRALDSTRAQLAIPIDIAIKLPVVHTSTWTRPLIVYSTPALDCDDIFRLTATVLVERLDWDRYVFVGLQETSRPERLRYGVRFVAYGSGTAPTRAAVLEWGSVTTAGIEIEIREDLYHVLLESTSEGRVQLRLTADDDASDVRRTALPPLEGDALSVGLPPADRLVLPRGTYRLIVGSYFQAPAYDTELTARLAVSQVELRTP